MEPTRPLPTNLVNEHGETLATSTMSPTRMVVRGSVAIASRRVIPVIVVPGIMGSNLRARMDVPAGLDSELQPGEAAWRPPTGPIDAVLEVSKWAKRSPEQRQRILHPDALEVDGTGEIDVSGIGSLSEAVARNCGWGEVHWDSYGKLLSTLYLHLNSTFQPYGAKRALQPHWMSVNRRDRREWSTSTTGIVAPLTADELGKHAGFQFPIYAFGYNWLQSNESSAKRLITRVNEIIQEWNERKHQCKQVILVTHSMGGLVARACAKQIQQKIIGIVHGVMPALGAPLCYRRIACGTETTAPGANWLKKKKMDGFATIAGKTPKQTTPTMATAPGPLELLPNHLYPQPWLFVTAKRTGDPSCDYLRLPQDDPYDLYRDTESWYRLIDPSLADPAKTHRQRLMAKIYAALAQAERFHKEVLGDYYHPNSYVFYGDDPDQPSYGECRWSCNSLPAGISANEIKSAKSLGVTFSGGHNLDYGNLGVHYFKSEAQDASGDGTVPRQSGAGPSGKVRNVFATSGYDHQGSYDDQCMLDLTKHLIVKMVQEVE